MTADCVDDLHAAEEHGEDLRLRVERLVKLWDAGDKTGVGYRLELADAEKMLRLSLDRFVRPSCDSGECDEDCGGFHPWGDGPKAPFADGDRIEMWGSSDGALGYVIGSEACREPNCPNRRCVAVRWDGQEEIAYHEADDLALYATAVET